MGCEQTEEQRRWHALEAELCRAASAGRPEDYIYDETIPWERVRALREKRCEQLDAAGLEVLLTQAFELGAPYVMCALFRVRCSCRVDNSTAKDVAILVIEFAHRWQSRLDKMGLADRVVEEIESVIWYWLDEYVCHVKHLEKPLSANPRVAGDQRRLVAYVNVTSGLWDCVYRNPLRVRGELLLDRVFWNLVLSPAPTHSAHVLHLICAPVFSRVEDGPYLTHPAFAACVNDVEHMRAHWEAARDLMVRVCPPEYLQAILTVLRSFGIAAEGADGAAT